MSAARVRRRLVGPVALALVATLAASASGTPANGAVLSAAALPTTSTPDVDASSADRRLLALSPLPLCPQFPASVVDGQQCLHVDGPADTAETAARPTASSRAPSTDALGAEQLLTQVAQPVVAGDWNEIWRSYDGPMPRPPWPVLCEGTGGDGKRVRLYFYRGSDQPALDDARRASFVQIAKEADRMLFLSAEARGEGRRVRWLTSQPRNGSCDPILQEIVGPPGSAQGAPGMLETFSARGVARSAQHLDMMFIDGDNSWARGYANTVSDDRPGPDNMNATGGRHAGLFRGGWSDLVAAHELVHLLGAVQDSAPHARGGHCNDGYDLLCYHTASDVDPACPLQLRRPHGLPDCGGDDYFNPLPASGNYLADHWNTADSPFLQPVPAAGRPPSTRITAGAGQTVLPHTGFVLEAEDTTPAGAFTDPSVRRWATSAGCVTRVGTSTRFEGYCLGYDEPGNTQKVVEHLTVDLLDRDAVAVAPLTVHLPEPPLPGSIDLQPSSPGVPAGDEVRLTATLFGQAPGQEAPQTPLVGMSVRLALRSVDGEPYEQDERRLETDAQGRVTFSVRLLESMELYVWAVGKGWQVPSQSVTVAVEPDDRPSAPRRLTATPGDGQAGLSWETPTGGVSPGTEQWEVVDSDGVVLARSPVTERTTVVTGLTNGRSYRLAVRAAGGGTAGLLTNPVDIQPYGPPSAPRGPIGWDDSPGEVSATWLPPGENGGSESVEYQARLDPSGVLSKVSPSEWTWFGGLENGRPYTVSVRARGVRAGDVRSDWGPWSAPSAPVVPADVPSVPRNVRATAVDGTVEISWDAPDSDGGAPVEGYLITNLTTGGMIAASAGQRREPWPAELLVDGDSYQFAVHAHNRAGSGPQSGATDPVVVERAGGSAPTPPGEPTPPDEPTPPATPHQPGARSIDTACPPWTLPPNPFPDVVAGSTHERAITCLVQRGITNGRTPSTYEPGAPVTREAMASFVARTILSAGGTLPESPADAFTDDLQSVHAHAINQLAAAGIVHGTGRGTYDPRAAVTRGQMAKFLASAAAQVRGSPLPADRDLFPDDETSPFENDINRIAAAGLTGGRADGNYDPGSAVLRDQMGSFLARTLDLLLAV